MIRKYIYGTPIETDAVIEQIPPEIGKPDHLTFETDKDGKHVYSCTLADDDIVYGLGEAPRGINKRGHIYESFNSDDPYHTEEKRSLYGSHNFIIVDSDVCFGAFFDCGAPVTFDIGYSEHDRLTVTLSENNYVLYIIEGDSSYEIVREFRRIIGKSYIAPEWAFGFQQSRWSYYTADDVRKVVAGYRDAGIPLDAVYLDIDYMEDYKDFTVSSERFPDFEAFVSEMKDMGIHLVPIIDAGVKIEDGYDIYEEGKEKGYFCKRPDGSDFVAAVWPGRTHFPDFLNSDARKWFGDKYKVLLDAGIDGFWNDMNEPAMFYTDEGVDEIIEYVKNFDFGCNSASKYFELSGKFTGLANRRKDYSNIRHNINGEFVSHDRVHNLFGYMMTRAAAEGFKRLAPDKEILIFSRSSYIGMHRYGGIWTGDNQSWWSHILLNIKMMPSLNMCGFIYSGADLGGFGANCTRDLLLRWLAFGIFTPLMRDHSALGTRNQECYSMGDIKAFKGIIKLRYRLLPYLYQSYLDACNNNDMMIKPLAFGYPDDRQARHIEDQLLVGDSIMITPVYEQNAVGRYVYLPEEMRLLIFKDADVNRTEVLPKGVHYIDVALDEVPIFIRKDKELPLCAPAQCTAKLNREINDIFC